MGIYYSPSAQGFYDDGINKIIPDDKIEITKEEHAALLAGGEIAVGPSGKPENKPSHWHTLNSAGDDWEITDENADLKDIEDEKQERKDEKKTEQDSSDLKNESVNMKRNKIRELFSAIPDTNELKAPILDAFDKIIPWLNDYQP